MASECSVRLNNIFGLIQNENVKRLAHIACNSLCADPEPPRSTVTKELSVSSNELRVVFCSENIKSLRVSFNNFMDLLMLCMEVIQRFDQVTS